MLEVRVRLKRWNPGDISCVSLFILAPRVLRIICQRNYIADTPQRLRYARFHRWRASERLVDAREVVIHVVDRDGMLVVLDLLREAVR